MENIGLTLKCIDFASKLKIKKIVIPGSTSEYLYFGKKINESSAPSAYNAYGSVKIAVRFLAEQMARDVNVPMIYVVLSSIYSADRQDDNVIYYTIRNLLAGVKPSLTNLEQLWDYIYIDDLIRALCLIGEKGKSRRLYTIGSGDNQPLSRYIYMIRDLINPKLPLGIGDLPYPDPRRLPSSCVDLTALQEDTGFVPLVPFSQGIQKVIAQIMDSMSKAQ